MAVRCCACRHDTFLSRIRAQAHPAAAHAADAPRSGAIYGGVAGGMTDEIDAVIKFFMADMMDHQAAIPAP